jgi:amidohydrolase
LPHQTADPIVAAGQIVTALQSVVSRNVDPQQTAVVTVGTINGGTAFNIIPSEVTLTGTVRTFEPQVRERVLQRLETLCQAVAEGMGVEVEWSLDPLTPAVINDAAATALIRQVARDFVGENNVIGDFRTMGSEDMAYFLQEVPGSYVFVGSANSEAGLDFPHHNPRFDIDEDVLPLAVGILAEATTRFVKQ